jgi:hypothetical protein
MFNSRPLFSISAVWVLPLLLQVAALNAQTRVVENKSQDPDIRCTIEVDRRDWKRDEPAAVIGTIENLFDGSIMPTLYLSRPAFPREDTYWAPVDVLSDRPLSLDERPFGSKSEAVAIRPKAPRLTFKKKGDSIHFRIDAQHILWDRTISSVWPSIKLFGIVEPGTYDVRLVLESERGECESDRVRVVVSAETK